MSGEYRIARENASKNSVSPVRESGNGDSEDIDVAIAIIEAAAARIEASDFTQAEADLLGQGCALDLIFQSLVRQSASGMLYHPMGVALAAQAQCNANLKSLLGLKKQNSRKRTIARAES